MKRYFSLIILSVFLFVQAIEGKEYNQMFTFKYKILKYSEICNLFWEKNTSFVVPNAYDNSFYIFGAIKLSSEAKFPTAMVEINIFDSKCKSLNKTYKLGWIGSAHETFFLIKLWDSETIPEIRYDFKILMRK